MQRRTLLGALSLGLSTAGLSACGFRLRGSVRTPQFALLIQGASAETARRLIEQLRSGGTPVWRSGDEQAPANVQHILVIHRDERQRVVQGSSASGQVRELRLKLNFRWSLIDDQDQEIVAPQDLLYEQDMSFNEADALGKSEEEAALFASMQERAIQATISRLSRVAR